MRSPRPTPSARSASASASTSASARWLDSDSQPRGVFRKNWSERGREETVSRKMPINVSATIASSEAARANPRSLASLGALPRRGEPVEA